MIEGEEHDFEHLRDYIEISDTAFVWALLAAPSSHRKVKCMVPRQRGREFVPAPSAF